MKMNSKNPSVFRVGLTVFLIYILSSCGPATLLPSPTPTSPKPANTATATATAETESSMLKAGLRYRDPSDDIALSFLDVIAFEATVNEEAALLEIILQLRDVPPTATHRQIRNLPEYQWMISIFLDPVQSSAANAQPDYYFFLQTLITDAPTGITDPTTGLEIMTPTSDEPEIVPINQLWDTKMINNNAGDYISNLDVAANPDLNTITLRGQIPGIKSNAVFSFATHHYSDTNIQDLPDNFVPEMENLPTPLPELTQQPPVSSTSFPGDDIGQLIPASTVRAYPGPKHYIGDVLTFEIQTDGNYDESDVPITMTLDDQEATEISAKSNFINLLLPLALDTTNLTGQHTIKFTTADGRLKETYLLEVLPTDQRPANEENAAWTTNELACCILHYISETAAARDIEFIAEHFQQAAEDFATITGEQIDPKLDVYIIDRIWGNGGFGGNGELVISYTDRYYGPTIGGEGLESLARHEFTHAAGVGLESAGDGINFNYEGLAVYVAGGHYKPEPLAERGAALYDLDHYVPVDQFIQQHELGYLHSAAILTYIVEEYGEEKLWEFFGADDDASDGQPLPLEDALHATFGISINDFDQNFQVWLESKEPGDQLQDLQLTIELQDLRRQYQDTYSPPPYFILAKAADAAARPEYLPVVIREANAAVNVAVELIIAQGQQAIVNSDYARAESLISVLRDVVTTGKFDDPLAKEYLDIVLVLEDAGYETLSLNLEGEEATAQVTTEPPIVTSLELQKLDGIWQIQS